MKSRIVTGPVTLCSSFAIAYCHKNHEWTSLRTVRRGCFLIGICIYGHLLTFTSVAQELEKVSVVPRKVDDEAYKLLTKAKKLRESGDAEAAVQLLDTALLRVQQYAPGANPATIGLMSESANAFRDLGDYATARQLANAALTMRLQVFGTKSSETTLGLAQVGWLAHLCGERVEAIEMLQLAVDRARLHFSAAIFADGHPHIQEIEGLLGACYLEVEDYDKSQTHLQESLKQARKLYPQKRFTKGHAALLQAILFSGRQAVADHQFGEGEQLYQEAEEMAQALFPREKYSKGHVSLAVIANNQGHLASMRGNFVEALEHYRRSEKIYRELFLDDMSHTGHPLYAITRHNMAVQLSKLGEYQKAQQHADAAIAMLKQLKNKDYEVVETFELARALETKARIADDLGQFNEAKVCYQTALDIRKKRNANNDALATRALARSLSSMGLSLSHQGKHDDAIATIKESVSLSRQIAKQKRSAPAVAELAERLNNLAVIYCKCGQHRQALPLFTECLQLQQNGQDSSSSYQQITDLARTYTNRGNALLKVGDVDEGLQNLITGFQLFLKQRENVSYAVSEAEAMNYVQTIPHLLDTLLSVWPLSDRTDQELYELIWKCKSIRTRVLAERYTSFRNISEPALLKKRDEYIQLRRDMVSVRYYKNAESMFRRKEELERELIQKSSILTKESRDLQLDDFIASLPAGTAVIDFYVYFDEMTNEESYMAFVLQKGESVRCVPLPDAESIDQTIVEWRSSITAPNDKQHKAVETAVQERLSKQVWSQCQSALTTSIEMIYLIPDGGLHFVPFNALPSLHGNRFLIQDYLLIRSPSADWLARKFQESLKATEDDALLAVGGLYFHQSPREADVAFSKKRMPFSTELCEEEIKLNKGKINYLKHSIEEVTYALHCANQRPKAFLFRDMASVDSVLRLLPQAECAILSTHGKYENANHQIRGSVHPVDTQLIVSGYERTTARQRNPLSRVFVSLSGSSSTTGRALNGLPSVRRLTGEQIATLPLSRLRWIVLSACETSLGDFSRGEELFNLPTCFHLAGAQNVISTLWPVSDLLTTKITMLYFDLVFRENKSPAEALRTAQLIYLESPEKLINWDGTDEIPRLSKMGAKSTVNPHALQAPKYWAGLTISGLGIH